MKTQKLIPTLVLIITITASLCLAENIKLNFTYPRTYQLHAQTKQTITSKLDNKTHSAAETTTFNAEFSINPEPDSENAWITYTLKRVRFSRSGMLGSFSYDSYLSSSLPPDSLKPYTLIINAPIKIKLSPKAKLLAVNAAPTLEKAFKTHSAAAEQIKKPIKDTVKSLIDIFNLAYPPNPVSSSSPWTANYPLPGSNERIRLKCSLKPNQSNSHIITARSNQQNAPTTALIKINRITGIIENLNLTTKLKTQMKIPNSQNPDPLPVNLEITTTARFSPQN